MAELAEPVMSRDSAVTPTTQRRGLAARVSVGSLPLVRRFLYVLLLLYVAKQAIYVIAFPPFSGHDEVAHYAYLQTVATEHRLPVLLKDRFPDQLYRYCRYTLDWYCDPSNFRYMRNPPTVDRAGHPQGLQYAANHPPLYYFIMTPLYWASDQSSAVVQQYLLRIAAIPFGIATVALAYLLARVLFPGDPFLATTVPGFVALQPQISYEAAMVNNDIVCIAFYSWILYLLVVGVRDRFPRRICLLLGVALGLALLSKGTSLTAAPVIGLTILITMGWRRVRDWIGRGALVALPAALLTAPWYAFLYRTYGNFSGLPQVDQIQWWNRPEGNFLEILFSRSFLFLRFKETWGEFGWRLIHFQSAMHWAIAVPLIVAFGGLVQYALTVGRDGTDIEGDPVLRPEPWQRLALIVLALTCAIAFLGVVQFGTRFELTQARYYFPAINAAALLLLLGLRTLVPRAYHAYSQTLIFASLIVLNLMIFTQYIIPFWKYPV